jgi:hypothetical protein
MLGIPLLGVEEGLVPVVPVLLLVARLKRSTLGTTQTIGHTFWILIQNSCSEHKQGLCEVQRLEFYAPATYRR